MFCVSDFKAAYSVRCASGPLSALVAGIILAGCAISTPLGPIFGSTEDTTGSIASQTTRLTGTMSDADWDQAKLALQQALDPQNPGQSVVWSNAAAGTHGSVTPVADAFIENKIHCRAFVAALAEGGMTKWYQGKGCQKDSTQWMIISAEPWALPEA